MKKIVLRYCNNQIGYYTLYDNPFVTIPDNPIKYQEYTNKTKIEYYI